MGSMLPDFTGFMSCFGNGHQTRRVKTNNECEQDQSRAPAEHCLKNHTGHVKSLCPSLHRVCKHHHRHGPKHMELSPASPMTPFSTSFAYMERISLSRCFED